MGHFQPTAVVDVAREPSCGWHGGPDRIATLCEDLDRRVDRIRSLATDYDRGCCLFNAFDMYRDASRLTALLDGSGLSSRG